MPKARRAVARRKAPARKARRRPARKGRSTVSRRKVFSRGTASVAVIKQPSGVPDRLFVKLKYVESLVWSQTLGTVGVNVYRGNSCFDPDATGTGGQPYFFDQWSALYLNYRVHGCKLKVMGSCNGGGGFNSVMMGITATNQSSSLGASANELYQEQPYTKKTLLRMGAASVGQGTVSMYMATRKILGLSKIQVEDQDYQASISANPTKQWYFHLWTFTPDDNTIAMNTQAELTYYVEFCNRAQPGTS